VTALLATEAVVCAFGPYRAVDEVTLALAPGETLGLVGESGSGKTTVLRLLLRLVSAGAGRILFDGRDITHAPERALRDLRRAVQVVFQNPHAALDPRASVFSSVAEPLRLIGGFSRAGLRDRVAALLHDVGLGGEFLRRYPHELSGGQKQRICIARALAPGPRALLLDEPTSALDVSVQAQIIELLSALRARHDLSYLFVSHNLAVVRLLCERVAVMRKGRLVEAGPAAQVLATPTHPYTKALLEAVLPPRATLAAVRSEPAASASPAPPAFPPPS
jgi:peptide/nickel transport system ATP-binding protein/oligopeptide transport system ATP-binding protein